MGCLVLLQRSRFFEDCLRENNVIPPREERAAVKAFLSESKRAKLVLKTYQPAAYQMLSIAYQVLTMCCQQTLFAVLLFSFSFFFFFFDAVTVLPILWGRYQYFRPLRWLRNIADLVCSWKGDMHCDELIDHLLEEHETKTSNTADDAVPLERKLERPSKGEPERPLSGRRERLAAVATGGQTKQYLGRLITAEQVDNLTEEEIEKLYARYEARLSAAMIETLGATALQLYATAASALLPMPVAELEEDPFVGHALSTELWLRAVPPPWDVLSSPKNFLLAPLTAAVTTAKYCKFRQTSLFDNLEGGSANTANVIRDGASSSRDCDTFGATDSGKSNQTLERKRC